MKRNFKFILTIALVLAVLVTALMPTGVAMATQYGSVSSDNADVFWYYGENHLNISAMKESVSKWISGADKNNPVVIGVIDTGVNFAHEVFQKTNTLYKVDGKEQGYNAFVGSGVAGVKNPTADEIANVVDKTTNSHGTAVASIMAMMIHELGLSDYIKIYPIKASRDDTTAFPDASVADGIKYAMDTQDTLGIDVLNLALCGYVAKDYEKHQQLFLNASSDMVIVAAAGNDNHVSSSKAGYPASLDGVLSVMGYDKDGVKTDSNYGDYDVTAPADGIYVAKGASDSYTTSTGTSMATAFVSVVSAVVTLREQTTGGATSSTVIARHVITSSTKSEIQYNGYSLPKFEGYASVNDPITDTYLEPTGITMTNDKDLSADATIYRGQHGVVTFTADLAPFGSTNPALANKVVWTLTEILSKPVLDKDGKETGEFEEYDGESEELGMGKSIDYTPDRKGTYRLTATYTNESTSFSASIRFLVKYVSYDSVAGHVQVSPSHIDGRDMGEKAGTIFTGDSLTFSLSNMEGVDPEKEIKWFVNGEQVSTGDTFGFAPTKSGEYVITAQYGDYRQVENVYTLTVKSAFFKTEVWASVLGVGVALIIGVVLTVVVLKKQKKA